MPPVHALIRLTVKPGSKQPGFQLDGESFVLRVRARAVGGAANTACIAALAALLDVAPSRIHLAAGARGRFKSFRIDGIDGLTAGARLRDRCRALPSPATQ